MAAAQTQNSSSESPKFQAPGEERFLRPDVHAGDRPAGASFASRSPALGCSGAAGTAHPIATQVGIEMLKRGGSAVDAAVAINACLGFMEPTSSGLGGDCYAFVWDPKLRKVVRAWPAPATRRSRSPLPPSAPGLKTESSRHSAPSPSPRPARSTAGGRCISATAGSSGPSSSSPPSITAKTVRPSPRSSAGISGATSQIFLRPDSGVEETANAMHTYAPGGSSPNEYDVFRNPDFARTYKLDRRRRPRRLLRRPDRRHHRRLFQAHRRLALAKKTSRAMQPEWIDPLVNQLPRRRRLRHGGEHPGPRHPADAQHPRELRPAAAWASSRPRHSTSWSKPSASPMKTAPATTPIPTSPRSRSSGSTPRSMQSSAPSSSASTTSSPPSIPARRPATATPPTSQPPTPTA